MSTLNWIFGTRGGRKGAGDTAEDNAEAGDRGDGAWVSAGTGAGGRAGAGAGAGAGGDGAGAGAGGDSAGAASVVGAEAEAVGKAGDDDAGAGDGAGDGTRQQKTLCLTPIARKCCKNKDWARYVHHSSESGSCSYIHSSDMSCQLIH